MEDISILNIERTVLSAIIFNPEEIEKIKETIEIKDFYSTNYQKIYEAILALYDEENPIVEEFIQRKLANEKLNNILIDILIATPIGNTIAYVKEMKKDSLNRQIKLLSCKLQNGNDLNVIDEIVILKNQLETISSEKKLNLISENNNFFDKYDMDFEKMKNIQIGYLILHFLVRNEITMISAKPSTGKSLISVALCNMLLLEEKVNYVFYIDGDNSLSTIKERNIHEIKKNFKTKFKYFIGLNKSDMQKIVNKLQKLDLNNTLVVFDSIKNFINGDRDKNKDVSIGMEILKRIRNNGASVLFQHHQNKPQKDFESDYAGSSAFLEDTSNAFVLTRNEDKNVFILRPFKARSGDLKELAYEYLDNHTLKKIDLDIAKETKEEVEIRNDIIDFILNAKVAPNYSQILKYLMDIGHPKMKSNEIIKNGKEKYWVTKKLKQHNKTVFSLLENPNKLSNFTVLKNEILEAS